MKWVTFDVAFLLTAASFIAGIVVYQEILGKPHRQQLGWRENSSQSLEEKR